MSFQIGDRVRFVCDDSPETREYMKGMTGTIIRKAILWDWMIKLDNPIRNAVTCANQCELMPLTDSDITITLTFTDILTLLVAIENGSKFNNIVTKTADYPYPIRETAQNLTTAFNQLKSRLLNYIQ